MSFGKQLGYCYVEDMDVFHNIATRYSGGSIERIVPNIKKVIFNKPATIVFWEDGTKTVVKCGDGEHGFDPEKGLVMAITKKALGNQGNYYNEIRKYVESYYDEHEESDSKSD